jgi:hypothetical protein
MKKFAEHFIFDCFKYIYENFLHMQTELDKLYKDYLNYILSEKEILDAIENFTLSSPQLIDVSVQRGKYLESDYKILVIGKETNYWFNKGEREKVGLLSIKDQVDLYIQELKSLYRKHNLGENYRSSIYTFIDLLIEKLLIKRQIGIILTELIHHDFNGGGVSYDLAMKLMYSNNYILRKEIEVMKPNALLFLTGPNYDVFIKHSYPDVKFTKYKDFNVSQISVLQGIPSIEKAIRIYHPDAHKYQGAQFRHDMINAIADYFEI